MPTIEQPMKVVKIRYVCDACGQGQMQHKESVKLSTAKSVAQKFRDMFFSGISYTYAHVHSCDVCGDVQQFEHVYPRTVYLQENTVNANVYTQ